MNKQVMICITYYGRCAFVVLASVPLCWLYFEGVFLTNILCFYILRLPQILFGALFGDCIWDYKVPLSFGWWIVVSVGWGDTSPELYNLCALEKGGCYRWYQSLGLGLIVLMIYFIKYFDLVLTCESYRMVRMYQTN